MNKLLITTFIISHYFTRTIKLFLVIIRHSQLKVCHLFRKYLRLTLEG